MVQYLMIALLLGAVPQEEPTPPEEPKPEPRKDQPTTPSRLRVTCIDENKGIVFDMFPDGRVELVVRSRDENTGRVSEKKHSAASMKEFREKHPDLVKKHELEKYIPSGADGFVFDELERLLRRWRDLGPDVTAWYSEVDKFLEKLGRRAMPEPDAPKPEPGPPPEQPYLGVQVTRVWPTLAAQLKIPAGQGLVVLGVEPETAASKAGLRIHDVILSLNGEPIADLPTFIERVKEHLKEGLTLEVLREGRKQTIRIEPME